MAIYQCTINHTRIFFSDPVMYLFFKISLWMYTNFFIVKISGPCTVVSCKCALTGTAQAPTVTVPQMCNFQSKIYILNSYFRFFFYFRRMTLQDCAERALKKGKCAEQQEGGKLASLLCFQMGPTLDTETLYKDMRSLFLTLINDTSLGIGAREQCCYTLSILCFVASHNLEEIEDIMKALSNVFKQKLPSDSPQLSALHSAALASWSLLYTLLPSKRVYDSAEANVTMLLKLLESGDVDLRITAGEAIALVYEGARDFDDEFTLANDSEDKNTGDLESELCNMLKSLATDSQKFRAKKDRRQQRSSFRDVLRAVEEGDTPDVHIKFGTEVLVLDSWSRKKQYDAICQVNVSIQSCIPLTWDRLFKILQSGEGGTSVFSYFITYMRGFNAAPYFHISLSSQSLPPTKWKRP
nr:EOG090X0ARF [Artemia franciscana]